MSRYAVIRHVGALELRPVSDAAAGGFAADVTVAFRRAKLVAGWTNDELRLPEVPA